MLSTHPINTPYQYTTRNNIPYQYNLPANNPTYYPTHQPTISTQLQGVGFSKIETEGLFSPYNTIRPEALQEGKGTGLGLALAKEIVIMHGGRVLRQSSVGKGSAFGFCIPFTIATAEDTAREGKTYNTHQCDVIICMMTSTTRL